MVRGEVVSVMAWESYDDLDVLERPPVRRYPARHGSGRMRRSMPYRIARGGFLGAYAGFLIFLMMVGVAILALYLLFAYVAPSMPAWGDKVSDKLEQLGTTTTTTP